LIQLLLKLVRNGFLHVLFHQGSFIFSFDFLLEFLTNVIKVFVLKLHAERVQQAHHLLQVLQLNRKLNVLLEIVVDFDARKLGMVVVQTVVNVNLLSNIIYKILFFVSK